MMLFTLMCVLSDELDSYMYQTVGMMLFTLMCVLSDELDSYMYQTVGHDAVHFDVCFVR